MVKLGPIREEACSILGMAIRICEEAGELHGRASANFAMNALHRIEHHRFDMDDDMSVLERRAMRNDLNNWTRNVSRFCVDVLRWAHEEEKRREIHAMQGFWTVFDVDPQTRAPTMKGWLAITQELEKWLGHNVKVDNGIQLRHGRLSFDTERNVFVFTWTERKKIIDF